MELRVGLYSRSSSATPTKSSRVRSQQLRRDVSRNHFIAQLCCFKITSNSLASRPRSPRTICGLIPDSGTTMITGPENQLADLYMDPAQRAGLGSGCGNTSGMLRYGSFHLLCRCFYFKLSLFVLFVLCSLCYNYD